MNEASLLASNEKMSHSFNSSRIGTKELGMCKLSSISLARESIRDSRKSLHPLHPYRNFPLEDLSLNTIGRWVLLPHFFIFIVNPFWCFDPFICKPFFSNSFNLQVLLFSPVRSQCHMIDMRWPTRYFVKWPTSTFKITNHFVTKSFRPLKAFLNLT